MAPAFSDAARALKGIVNFGIVDCNQYNRLSFIDSVISLAYTRTRIILKSSKLILSEATLRERRH